MSGVGDEGARRQLWLMIHSPVGSRRPSARPFVSVPVCPSARPLISPFASWSLVGPPVCAFATPSFCQPVRPSVSRPLPRPFARPVARLFARQPLGLVTFVSINTKACELPDTASVNGIDAEGGLVINVEVDA